MILKKIIFCFLSFSLILFTSCKDQKKEAEGDNQMEQVMAIHDEVMPKMGKLGKLVAKLKPIADSLGADSPQAIAMRDLQIANKSMMDWMQDFGNRFDSEEIMEGKALTAEKQKWLDEEEEKVKNVKEEINSSIEKAEALLESSN